MGIIILPFLLVALISFILAAVNLWYAYKKKQLHHKNILFGSILMFGLYAILYVDYRNDFRAWVLGTYFMFPFVMILVPFAIGLILKVVNRPTATLVSNSLFACVVLSTIFMIVFNQFTFGIIDYLGIQKHY
jgi:hypothetical protein